MDFVWLSGHAIVCNRYDFLEKNRADRFVVAKFFTVLKIFFFFYMQQSKDNPRNVNNWYSVPFSLADKILNRYKSQRISVMAPSNYSICRRQFAQKYRTIFCTLQKITKIMFAVPLLSIWLIEVFFWKINNYLRKIKRREKERF